MAWIEQTKKSSRKSGGPQYYLQGLRAATQAALESFGRCPVRLWTPYGVVESGLEAVSRRLGSVGHDRVQSGRRVASVADQIAHWFRLRKSDIETLEFDDSFADRAFVIRPSRVKFFSRKPIRTLFSPDHPLSVTPAAQSELFASHLRHGVDRSERSWVRDQLKEIVDEHDSSPPDLDERDLLRVSGALSKVGVRLGPYRSRGIDCPDARFELGGYPAYACPVEIEERSAGFLAPHHDRHRAQRVVVLCMYHDAPATLREHVDVIELRALARLLDNVA